MIHPAIAECDHCGHSRDIDEFGEWGPSLPDHWREWKGRHYCPAKDCHYAYDKAAAMYRAENDARRATVAERRQRAIKELLPRYLITEDRQLLEIVD